MRITGIRTNLPKPMPRARRIVSISPSNTEILHALGLGRRIVGVDDWSDYPPRVRSLPKLGSDLRVDIERVRALQPDLVVASLHVPGMEANIAGFEAAGFTYLALGGLGLDGIWEDMRGIGHYLGRSERAEAMIAQTQGRMRAVAARCGDTGVRPRVHWEWSAHPFVAARRSWITEMLHLAGAENVYGDLDVESVRVTPDEAVRRDPDVVVACWCGARKLPTLERIQQRWDGRLSTKATAVFAEDLFGRPGPRLADGLERLAELLHPSGAAGAS
ncbi:MAG: cobalamin-binding protein [Chloroflexi bacterium]|nr:cobalamin-binding protein [Chloroflexota bacterium]